MLDKLRNILHLSSGSAINVSTDSRNCQPGSVFFALRGDTFDGNQYAGKALENGAALAVVDNPDVVNDDRYLLVDDVLKALQSTASEYRDEFDIPVIGITGTNGKTTTKELIAACLSKKYSVHYTHGNLNNHIGVPLTLLSMPRQTQIAVIEMGASHPGDIQELVAIAHPTCGIITNVGRAHLQGFGSFEGVVKTKCELYDYIREHNGLVFVNSDNKILGDKSLGMHIVHYSAMGLAGDNHGLMRIRLFERDIDTHLVGLYNAENVAAASAIAQHFSVSADAITEAIEHYVPTNNRSQRTITDRNTLIVDAYNANPTSMEAAIDNFNNINAENKMLILGQMGELGAYQYEAHRHIVDKIRGAGYEHVLLVGENFRAVADEYPVFGSTEELMAYLKDNPISNHTILIKGSHSNRLDTIVPLL